MTRQQLALSLLEEAGSRGVTTAEFMDAGVGSRYSARIMELRKQGHRITSERVREGSWRYTLEFSVGPEAIEGLLAAKVDPDGDATLKLFESAA